MNLNLDQLEEHLQALIEVHLLSYLPNKNEESMVAQELAAAMQHNLKKNGDVNLAPNIYTLRAHPTLIEKWRGKPDLVKNFKRVIKTIAAEAKLDFVAPLDFSLAPDPELGPGEIRFLATQGTEEIEATKDMETQNLEDKATSPAEEIPQNAFLIIHGSKVFPLKKSVINIGRRMENDLTIDDPRVSRAHAQLRVKNGRFVIFDINSTGGTYVNSQRSHQSILYPGDVISLAGVPLIYGQDNPPRRADLEKTIPLNSPMASNLLKKTLNDTPKVNKK